MPRPSDRLIIGTAGHIDHGKSTLVKALTGIDPDRLKEEKERGITIVLGFAPLQLPSGRRFGVVDVPGHERLVRTMIAGATGIDIVLLVVAADEGVMPQTREHVAICELLGVERGLVALTKSDLVDEDWMELVRGDLHGELEGTFLERAEVVACSSTTGAGLPELAAAIDRAAAGARGRDTDGLLRLPIDRVFTMKGFGTVVTGTLLGGRVQVGQAVELSPSGVGAKVRGIEVHGEQVGESVAGLRTAVNLQGAETASIRRGEWLLEPGAFVPSRRLEGRLGLLGRPLRDRARVLVHTGTTHVEATVRLLEAAALEPGASGLAHVELDAPLVVMPGDRLVVRGTERLANHGHTIGGLTVLRPHPTRPRVRGRAAKEARAIETASAPADLAALVVAQAGALGVGTRRLAPLTGLGPAAVRAAVKELTRNGTLVAFGQEGLVHAQSLASLVVRAEGLVRDYHDKSPLEPGMPREELRSKLAGVSPALFGLLLERMGRSGQLAVEAERVRLAAFKPRASERAGGDVDGLKARIMEQLRTARLTPPRDKELAASLGVEISELRGGLKLLVGDGVAVKVAEELYFAKEHLDRLEQLIIDHLDRHGSLDAQGLKDLTGASRKFTIPLGEHFDRQKVTMRVGEVRVRRGRKG